MLTIGSVVRIVLGTVGDVLCNVTASELVGHATYKLGQRGGVVRSSYVFVDDGIGVAVQRTFFQSFQVKLKSGVGGHVGSYETLVFKVEV